MDEFSLYITVPGRKNRKAVETGLADILRKTKGAADLRLTWIMEGRHAGWTGARWVLKCLKRIGKEPADRLLVNVMEFRAWRGRIRLLLPGLSRYIFRMSFRLPPEEEKKLSRMADRLARRKISPVVYDSCPSRDGWLSWLNSPDYRPAEPYLDYLKIFMGSRPISCRYRSCLGRTLALDAEGRWGICPYLENNGIINDPAGCESLDEVFQTDRFIRLLKKQVAVRDRCAAGCRYYRGCKGGCPLSAEEPCPEPELLRALQAVPETGLPACNPAVREERLDQLAQRFTV